MTFSATGVAMGLHADRLEDGVRPATVGISRIAPGTSFTSVRSIVRAPAAWAFSSPVRHEVDGDDVLDPAVPRGAHGELADGPQTEDGEGASGGDGGILDALPRGGEDVER